jgi:hypothetical protein
VNGRNRSEGWTHAKLSGHALEDQLADALQRDSGLASGLHEDCFGVAEPLEESRQATSTACWEA